MGIPDRDYTKRDSNGNLTILKKDSNVSENKYKKASPRWKVTYPESSTEKPVSEYEISDITLENKKAELESVLNNPNIHYDEKIRLKRKLKADIKYIKISLGYETNTEVINTSKNEYNYSSKKTTFYNPKTEVKSKSLFEKITSKISSIFKSDNGKN